MKKKLSDSLQNGGFNLNFDRCLGEHTKAIIC